MTRRPKKTRAGAKPARKAARPARRAKAAAKPKPAKPPRRDAFDDLIAAGARVLEIKVEKSWLPAVRAHLEVTLRHGALVADFALPDETDPAPVFEA